MDYERFLEEVLIPLSKQETVYYQAFDCSTMSFHQVQEIKYHPINIIEGSYALHPIFKDYYTDSVVLYIESKTQKERLKERNPKKMETFIQQWIPLENRYFEYYHIYQNYPHIKMD